MKNLAPSSSQYLLEAPIDILHRESMEWLEEIAFWEDEVSFFYKIIGMALQVAPLKMNTDFIREVERHLVYISTESLTTLKDDARNHEKHLDTRKKDAASEVLVYRSKHRRLHERFYQFEKEFRELKRNVFKLIEASLIKELI